MKIEMSWGRDYQSPVKSYEYIISQCVDESRDDWEILARCRYFKTSGAAKKAGMAKVIELGLNND
jgi:hypothetical protein